MIKYFSIKAEINFYQSLKEQLLKGKVQALSVSNHRVNPDRNTRSQESFSPLLKPALPVLGRDGSPSPVRLACGASRDTHLL